MSSASLYTPQRLRYGFQADHRDEQDPRVWRLTEAAWQCFRRGEKITRCEDKDRQLRGEDGAISRSGCQEISGAIGRSGRQELFDVKNRTDLVREGRGWRWTRDSLLELFHRFPDHDRDGWARKPEAQTDWILQLHNGASPDHFVVCLWSFVLMRRVLECYETELMERARTRQDGCWFPPPSHNEGGYDTHNMVLPHAIQQPLHCRVAKGWFERTRLAPIQVDVVPRSMIE